MRVVLAQDVIALKEGYFEQRVFYAHLRTAATANDFHLVFAAGGNKMCEKSKDFDSKKNDKNLTESTAGKDNNKKISVSGELFDISSAPGNGGSLQPSATRQQSTAPFRHSFCCAIPEWRALVTRVVLPLRKSVTCRVGDNIIHTAF